MNPRFLLRSTRQWGTALVLTVGLGLVVPGIVAQPSSAQSLNQQFEALIERYLKEVRGVGGRTPNDMSAAGFKRELETRRAILKDLRAIDRKTLNFDQDIDYRFLEGILVSNIVEDEQVKRWQQNPREYLNIGSLSYRLDADPRPPEARAAEMVEDLKLLQARMANGRKNLSQHIPRWVELTHPMLDGIQAILERQVTAFAERSPVQKAALLAENQRALAAVNEFRAFLKEELVRKPEGDWKIGAELYNTLHRTRYMFPENDMNLRRIARGPEGFTRLPAYHDWGWKQFGIVEKQLVVQARKIDPAP